MERQIDLKEISDGRLYGANDMVRADAAGCKGCSACCRGMGTSIVLDPYDIFQLCKGLHTDFSHLLAGPIELQIQDGLILPNIKMQPDTDACAFLDKSERCSIHDFRSGFCRLFPLGRYYDGIGFSYFLQVKECPKPGKSKVKIKNWLHIPNYPQYEQFINEWHYFLKRLTDSLKSQPDEARQKQLSMYILQQFYLMPYDTEAAFYGQFQERMTAAKAQLS